MEKELKHILTFFLSAILLMFVSGVLGGIIGYNRGSSRPMPEPLLPDTVKIFDTDTCWLLPPEDSVTKKEDKVVQVPLDDVEVDSVVDSVRVTLPFEQHFASLDSVADIWYSGYQVRIDSVVVYRHRTTEIINQPYPYEVSRMPKLTADIGASAFYCDGRVNPCLIGEVRLNQPKTTFSVYGTVDHEGKWSVGVGVSYRITIVK
jgi:hypothetical protein